MVIVIIIVNSFSDPPIKEDFLHSLSTPMNCNQPNHKLSDCALERKIRVDPL